MILLFSARVAVQPPMPVPAAILQPPRLLDSPAPMEIAALLRSTTGQVGIVQLEAKAAMLENDLTRFTAERDEVQSLRQRMGRAMVQAEYEGRPAWANGRYMDRNELRDVITRADRWLKQCDAAMEQTRDRIKKLSIAAGTAKEMQLEMQRVEKSLNANTAARPGSVGSAGAAQIQEQRKQLRDLGLELEKVVNPPELKIDPARLVPFEVAK
jgi:hypothetical protein